MAVQSSPKWSRLWWWTRRFIVAVLGVVILLALLTWSAGSMAKSNLTKRNPAPGRLVDVGGYKMHINCTGLGRPTVILEAGLHDFSLFWSLVQPEVARFTRVCAYDRAGYGWSESSPYPRTSETMVAELHTLLDNADESGPYVLVGHSFGGALVRLYTQLNPDDVVGIVLVDPAQEELFTRIPEWRLGNEYMLKLFRTLEPLSASGILALSPGTIPNRGLPDDALVQYQAILATTETIETSIAETEAFENNLAQVATANITSFGNLPLIVISNGLWKPLSEIPGVSGDENQQAWQAMQSELTTLSSNSKQVVAEQSEHFIQLQEPDHVIEAIREIVESIEK